MSANTAVDINGKPYHRNLLVMVMLIGSFCTVLNQTILATAFPTLMKAFDISTATVQWLTTGFMMVNGIMIPVSAYLSNKFNSKWLYISAMTIFELGTITAFAAPNFGTLLCGRLIQATGVGITMPLMQNIMLTIFPPEKRGAAMGINGLVIALAPALGPSLSGWVVDNYSWRVLFGMIIPIVAIVIFASFFLMQNVIKTTDPTLDWLSLLISTVGFGSVLYGFSSVGDKGWTDAIVWGTILIGVILITILIWRQNRLEHPFLNFKVFKTPEFALATLLSSVVMIAMVGIGPAALSADRPWHVGFPFWIDAAVWSHHDGGNEPNYGKSFRPLWCPSLSNDRDVYLDDRHAALCILDPRNANPRRCFSLCRAHVWDLNGHDASHYFRYERFAIQHDLTRNCR